MWLRGIVGSICSQIKNDISICEVLKSKCHHPRYEWMYCNVRYSTVNCKVLLNWSHSKLGQYLLNLKYKLKDVVIKQEPNLMLWPAFTNDVLDCLSNLAAFSDDYTFDNSVEIEWDPSIDWSRHVLCLFNYFLLSRDGSVLLQIDVDHENGGLKLNEDFLVTNQVKFVRASPTGMT